MIKKYLSSAAASYVLARRVRSTCSNAENFLRFRLEMGEMIDCLVDGRDLVVMIATDEMPRRH